MISIPMASLACTGRCTQQAAQPGAGKAPTRLQHGLSESGRRRHGPQARGGLWKRPSRREAAFQS